MTRSRTPLFFPAAFLLVVLAVLGTARHFYIQWNPAPPPCQAFVDGRILTMDERNRIAQVLEKIREPASRTPEGEWVVEKTLIGG